MHSHYNEVDVFQHNSQKWELSLQDSPVRAFGTTRSRAYNRFLAVVALYEEYGDNWMSAVLADRNEEYVDSVMRAAPAPQLDW